MPDANGNFKGMRVNAAAWERIFGDGPRSVWENPCECTNPDRGAYKLRFTQMYHCVQCDGLLAGQS